MADDRLRRLVLFGSRARGDARPGSDYDLLVVVDRKEPELCARLHEVAAQIELDTLADVSLKIYSEEVYQRSVGVASSFWAAIAREGVVLWTL